MSGTAVVGAAPLDLLESAIIWQRLQAVVDEGERTLGRTAFSSVVRESHDYVTALLDVRGRNVVQATYSIAAFVGTLPVTAAHLLARFPLGSLLPGDVLATNDPYLGTGHAYDLTVITPIFHRDRVVAVAGSVAHLSNIGGGLQGSALGRSTYEEGLCIPPVRLLREGRPVEEVWEFIRANVRVPLQVVGDIEAQLAANDVIARGVGALLDEYGLGGLDALAEEWFARCERATRAAIGSIPEGRYSHQVVCDGFDAPLRVAVHVEVSDDAIAVDFTGTSPLSPRGVNSVMNYTRAYTIFTLQCLLGSEIPNNEGALRPFVVTAPEGCCLNASHPAPTSMRGITGQLTATAVMGALAGALPGSVLAESGATPSWRIAFSGLDDAGAPFVSIVQLTGGLGARLGRDGYSSVNFPVNCMSTPVEALEAWTPVLVGCKEWIPDSGGSGTWRGGLGQRLTFRPTTSHGLDVSVMADKMRHSPRGLAGGRSGRRGRISLASGRACHPKGNFRIAPDDTLTLELPGGGGYGPPARRAVADVRRDLDQGLVTAA